MNNREKIDKLKEEYKVHYRAMNETSKRMNAARRRSNIVSALRSMDSEELMSSMEVAMDSVREKMAKAEARMEVMFENWFDEPQNDPEVMEFEKTQRKKKAQDTIRHIKNLTERYESELDDLIHEIEASKTLGISTENSTRNSGESYE